jgi:drug/metabolite transporter (DMT)-like permease
MFDAARARFEALPGPLRGALLMTVAAAAFAGMNAIIRALSFELHPFQSAFFRVVAGLAFMLPWLAHAGISALATASHKLYASRALMGYISMLCWFSALALMPVAEATALSFTSPLFATVAAALLLGEIVRLRRWSATIVGFVGAMVVIRPGFETIEFAHLLVLASAALGGWNAITVKQLTRTDNPNVIVLYMTIYLTPMSLIPALFVWQTPSWHALGLVFVMGVLATIGHQTFTRALAACEASFVLPFDFVRLPMVAFIAYLAFGESPDIWTWIGGGIIVAATVYIARREAQLARLAAPQAHASETGAVAKRPDPAKPPE